MDFIVKIEQSLTESVVLGKAKLYAKAGPVEIQFLKIDHQKTVFFRCQTVSFIPCIFKMPPKSKLEVKRNPVDCVTKDIRWRGGSSKDGAGTNILGYLYRRGCSALYPPSHHFNPFCALQKLTLYW